MKDFIISALAATLLFWLPNHVGETTVQFHSFGAVKIFKNPSDKSTGVVILLSGKKGWSIAENDLAYNIAAEKKLVIGVDSAKYQSPTCKLTSVGEAKTLSQDLITLAKATEQLLKFESYIRPSVIAFQEASEQVLPIAMDARGDSFLSVNAVGRCFTPILKSRCTDVSQAQVPVHIFYDERESCPDLQKLAKSNSLNIDVQKVSDLNIDPYKLKYWSHEMKEIWRSSSNQKRSMASYESSGNQEKNPKLLEDLPLITLEPAEIKRDSLVILYSGDGGWSDFTQELAGEYLKRGYPVVGLNSLFYFWNPKNPEVGAADLSKIIQHFQKRFHRKKIIVTGFSFGADVIPFFINRLDKKTMLDITEINLLAPGQNAQFKFEIKDWFKDEDIGVPILPELKKISGVPIKCLHALGDRFSVCSKFSSSSSSSILLKGGHHFNNDFDQFNRILW